MSLPWVRLEAGLAQNPKILDLIERKAHRAAFGYVLSIAYAATQDTDGYLPPGALPFLHLTRKDADTLVTVGLWQRDGNGWRIPDYLEYQPGKAYKDQHKRAVCARWIKEGRPCSCGTHTPYIRAVDTSP